MISSPKTAGHRRAAGGSVRDALARLSIALLLHTLSLPGCVSYNPRPLEEAPFQERVATEAQGGLRVSAAALGQKESADLFGVPLAKQGIQPVWLEIENGDDEPYVFFQQTVDADYYSPREAAYKNRFSTTKRVFSYGLASLLLWPLILVAPFQYFTARSANGRMEEVFAERGIGNRAIEPGQRASGFVFTHLDEGTKQVRVMLLGPGAEKEFALFVQVPGARLDHYEIDLEDIYAPEQIRDLEANRLREALSALPCCTTNRKGNGKGDPVNLIMIGEFDVLLQAFTRAGWDETELIDVTSSLRTARSFVFGSQYRYSPVSNLYLYGRKQDVAFQKARATIHERNHLRLWYSPLRHEGRPVWVGQVSRDIGVKFTTRTWNLTTHAIDPDIDDSREAVMGDLLQIRRVTELAYVPGVGESSPERPARNLMNDPYWTDGRRGVALLSDEPVEPHLFRWE